MTIGQIALLALPTSLKWLTDLYYIRIRKMPINHRSELRSFLGWGVLVSLVNAFLMPEYQLWVRILQSAIFSSAIFFQFFDWGMGLALHGKIFYESVASDGAKTDSLMAKLNPINSTFLRLFYSALAYALYFQIALTQWPFLK